MIHNNTQALDTPPVHLVFPLGLKAAGCVGFGGLFLAKDSFFSLATLVFTGFTGLLFALIFDRLIFLLISNLL
jgi:hypothetical protein